MSNINGKFHFITYIFILSIDTRQGLGNFLYTSFNYLYCNRNWNCDKSFQLSDQEAEDVLAALNDDENTTK